MVEKNKVRIFGEVDRGQGGCGGVHREVVVAFMVIASQHPIVIGLSGRSNLGAEVDVFCTLAEQTIVISSGAGGSDTLSCLVFWE